MGSKGGGTNTIETQSGPPAQVLQEYQNVTNQANNVASQPLSQYTGTMVSGFTPQQLDAFNTIQNSQGVANPYINSAASLTAQGATPINVPGGYSSGQIDSSLYGGQGQLQSGFGTISNGANYAAMAPGVAQGYVSQGTGMMGQGAGLVGSAVGMSSPYVQAGGQGIGAGMSQAAAAPSMASPYIEQGMSNISQGAGMIGNTGNYLSSAMNSAQFNPNQINSYYSPYVSDVVNSTEAQLNNQNAQQQQSVIGNAIASGAWGGDRSAVAQSLLAGQQQLTEAPEIANLENTGYQSALGTQEQYANLGATTGLGAAGANTTAGMGLTSAGTAAANAGLGYGNLGVSSGSAQMQGGSSLGNLGLGYGNEATTAGSALGSLGSQVANAGLGLGSQYSSSGQAQTAAGTAQGQIGAQNIALGENQQQQGVGAQEASGWLAENAGYGMGNLGNEAQNTALSGANAELQAGGLQQTLNQEETNIPYEMFQQQQAYPYQQTGWLSNIAEGLGAGSGGTGSTTYPGASLGSQLTGLGLTGLAGYGLANQAGLLGSATSAGLGASAASAGAEVSGWDDLGASAASAGWDDLASLALAKRGGVIRRHHDSGGNTPVAGFATSPNTAPTTSTSGLPPLPTIGADPIPTYTPTTVHSTVPQAPQAPQQADPAQQGLQALTASNAIGNILKPSGHWQGGRLARAFGGGANTGGKGGAMQGSYPTTGGGKGGQMAQQYPQQQTSYGGGKGGNTAGYYPQQQNQLAMQGGMGTSGLGYGSYPTTGGGKGGQMAQQYPQQKGAFANFGGTAQQAQQQAFSGQNPLLALGSGSSVGGGSGVLTPYGQSMESNPQAAQQAFTQSISNLPTLQPGQTPVLGQAYQTGPQVGGKSGAASGSYPQQQTSYGGGKGGQTSQQYPQQQSYSPGKGGSYSPQGNMSATGGYGYGGSQSGAFANPQYTSYGLSVPQLSTASQAMPGTYNSNGTLNTASASNWSPPTANQVAGLGSVYTPPTTTTATAGSQDQLTSQEQQLLAFFQNQGYARGGRIHRDDGGTLTTAGAINAGVPQAGGSSPMAQGMMQNYQSLPTEKLQELAVRVPPSSAQGQMIKRVLASKQMNPAGSTPQQQPLLQGLGTVPAMASGGRVHRDDGGSLMDYAVESNLLGLGAGFALGGPIHYGDDDSGPGGAVPGSSFDNSIPSMDDQPYTPTTLGQILSAGLGPKSALPQFHTGPYQQTYDPNAVDANGYSIYPGLSAAQHTGDFLNQTGTTGATKRALEDKAVGIATKDAKLVNQGNQEQALAEKLYTNPNGWTDVLADQNARAAAQTSRGTPAFNALQYAADQRVLGLQAPPIPEPQYPTPNVQMPPLPNVNVQSSGSGSRVNVQRGTSAPQAPTPTQGMAPVNPQDIFDQNYHPVHTDPTQLAARNPNTSQQNLANSPWLPLLYAGLGTMGGRSPNALVNIGEGGMMGLKAMQQQASAADDRQKQDDTRTIENARLANESRSADAAANTLSAKMAETKATIAQEQQKQLDLHNYQEQQIHESAADRAATAAYRAQSLKLQGDKSVFGLYPDGTAGYATPDESGKLPAGFKPQDKSVTGSMPQPKLQGVAGNPGWFTDGTTTYQYDDTKRKLVPVGVETSGQTTPAAADLYDPHNAPNGKTYYRSKKLGGAWVTQDGTPYAP